MRSGDLPTYLSLNRLLNDLVLCSWCYFVQIQSISQKFISCVTDGWTDRRTDRQTDTSSFRDAWTHLKNREMNAWRAGENQWESGRAGESRWEPVRVAVRAGEKKTRLADLWSVSVSHEDDVNEVSFSIMDISSGCRPCCPRRRRCRSYLLRYHFTAKVGVLSLMVSAFHWRWFQYHWWGFQCQCTLDSYPKALCERYAS